MLVKRLIMILFGKFHDFIIAMKITVSQARSVLESGPMCLFTKEKPIDDVDLQSCV